MRNQWRILVGLLLSAVSSSLLSYQSHYVSPRSIGRGSAYVAGFRSNDALVLNPALLGYSTSGLHFDFLAFDLFYGENTLSLIGDAISALSSSDGFSFIRKFDDKFGQGQFIRGQLSGLGVGYGRFMGSPILMNESSLEVRSPAIPSVTWNSDTLVGVNLSYGFALSKTWSVGLSIRPLQRIYLTGDLTFTDLVDLLPPVSKSLSDFLPVRSGFGVALDTAVLWLPRKDMRVSMLIQDLGSTGYITASEKRPPNIPQRVSLGGLYMKSYKGFSFDVLCDLQDLAAVQKTHFLNLVKLGVEVGRAVFGKEKDFGLTAGVNQGYFSGGLFLDLYAFRLELANYGTEMGYAPGQEQERRWLVSANTSLTF